jgi:hypothetical protein
MSYIPALMRRGGGKNRGVGKNAMLWRVSSVYNSSRSLHYKFRFHFSNLAGRARDMARMADPAIGPHAD